MPVRKIPKTYRSISGRFPSAINKGRCIGYESKLERDFYLCKEFDRTISDYEEQPIKFSGEVDGKKVSYTPDSLINFHDGKPAQIVEIKYQEELTEKADELKPRFDLARNHTKENGMEFVIATEEEIYAGCINNYRLIYRFTKPPINSGPKIERITALIESAGTLTLKDLLLLLGETRAIQAQYTTTIWHLLYTGEIEANLNEPIGYQTILRIKNGY